MLKIKAMVDAGAIGPKPWYYRFTMSQTPRLDNIDQGWAYLANLITKAGSSTADCGIHYVDLLRWWTGEEVTHVSSIGVTTEGNPRPEGHNLGLLAMHLSDGSVGWIEDNWARVTRATQDMELIGPEGRIAFQFANFRVKHMEREGDCLEYFSKKTYRTELVPLPCTGAKQTGAQFKELVRQIEQNEDVSKHLDDVYKCTEVVLAANTAAEEKRTIQLPLGL
jgi:predicted dehydrogenase